MKNIIIGFWSWLFKKEKIWQKERLEACNKCAPYSDTCPVCHCFKVPKTRVRNESCPKRKWPEEIRYDQRFGKVGLVRPKILWETTYDDTLNKIKELI